MRIQVSISPRFVIMFRKGLPIVLLLALLLAALGAAQGDARASQAAAYAAPGAASEAALAAPLGSGFTYQGVLRLNGAAINDVCDFRFSLWDGEADPSAQIGATQDHAAVPVNGGQFTIPNLDFGANRWMAARPGWRSPCAAQPAVGSTPSWRRARRWRQRPMPCMPPRAPGAG